MPKGKRTIHGMANEHITDQASGRAKMRRPSCPLQQSHPARG